MKIEHKSKELTLCFQEVKEGTVFISCDGDVCMKTGYIKDKDANEECNTVILETGELTFFEGYELVTLPVNAKLVIE